MPANDSADLRSFIVSGAANEVIYKAGDPATHVFIVERGRIEIVDAGPRSARLALVEAGDFFGEQALLGQQPRNQLARALSPYTLFRLEPRTFTGVVNERPDVAVQMLRRLVARAAHPSSPPAEAPREPAPPARPPTTPTAGNQVYNRSPQAPVPATVASLVHAESGTRFGLTSGIDAIVGRRDKISGFVPDVDLTALDSERTLGRRHLKLRWHHGRCFASEEKTSVNGSFVNGSRLEKGAEVELKDGDRIQLGVVGLLFEQR